MFGVFAGQFGADLRVAFAPERGEVAGDLDWALVGREDLDDERDALVGDPEFAFDTEKILDPYGDAGGVWTGVLDLELPTVWHFETFGKEAIQGGILGGGKPASDDGPDLAFFDLPIGGCSEADLFDEGGPIVGMDCGDLPLGELVCGEVDPLDPGFDAIVPLLERAAAGFNLDGEEACGIAFRDGVRIFCPEHEVDEPQLFPCDDATLRGIEKGLVHLDEVFGEHFADPGFLDERDHSEQDFAICGAGFGFTDLACDEETGRFEGTIFCERSAAVVHEVAATDIRIVPEADLVREGGEQAAGDIFVV